MKHTLEVLNFEFVRNDTNAHIETEIVCIDIIRTKCKYRLITVYLSGCTMDCIEYFSVLITDLELLVDVNYDHCIVW